MRPPKSNWVKVFIIVITILIGIAGSGYLYVLYQIGQIEGALTGCSLESKSFTNVIGFTYVSNWIVVKVKFPGIAKCYDFILDTGAQTVFSDSLINEIGPEHFKKYTVQTDTSSHAFKNQIVSLDTMQIGCVRFSNIGGLIVDNEEWGMLNSISPYGIIGYNVLQSACFQINYADTQIIITDKVDNLHTDTVSWMNYRIVSQETPVISAIINDSLDVDLLFDTGYSGFMELQSRYLYTAISRSWPESVKKFISQPVITVAGGSQTEICQNLRFKAEALTIGKSCTRDAVVIVKDVKEGKYAGLLGNKYFENFIITLDYKNRRVGFTENDDTVDSEAYPSFGLGFTPRGTKLFIKSVYSGSEADMNGIEPGDEIVSINSIKIAELPPEAFAQLYRGEFRFIERNDTKLTVEIEKQGSVTTHQLHPYPLF